MIKMQEMKAVFQVKNENEQQSVKDEIKDIYECKGQQP